jgi:hypothetical protein
MRRVLGLLAALALSTAVLAADSFDYKLTYPDGVPGVMHATVGKKTAEKYPVTCNYEVSQRAEMDMDDMPLGSWSGTETLQKVDRDAVRSVCLRHYEDRQTPD